MGGRVAQAGDLRQPVDRPPVLLRAQGGQPPQPSMASLTRRSIPAPPKSRSIQPEWSIRSTKATTPGQPADQTFSFRVVHTTDAVYVAVNVIDDQIVNDTVAPGEGGNVWQDDSVEIFFDAKNERGTGCYHRRSSIWSGTDEFYGQQSLSRLQQRGPDYNQLRANRTPGSPRPRRRPMVIKSSSSSRNRR